MKLKNLQILLHPYFILSLLILIINDHYLKANYPSFITGKLSDFAGLFVFTIFIFAMAYSFFSRKSHLIYLHISVAVFFTLWKLAPVEIFLNWLNETTSLTMPTRVKDSTDLLSLVILLFSFMFITSELKERFKPDFGIYKNILVVFVLLASSWSIMATSYPVDLDDVDYDGYFTCCNGMRGNVDGDENDEVSVADLTYLVTYLNKDGPRPSCLEEADINASGDKNPINEDDLYYLVAYIMQGGPPPCDCPRDEGY